MVKKYNYSDSLTAEGLKIAIIKSNWNSGITEKLKSGCLAVLHEKKANPEDIMEFEVPGAYELPAMAKMVIKHRNPDVVICLGCLIKGDTKHDEWIASSIAKSMLDIAVDTNVPVIFGVLTTDNAQQAIERSGGKMGNKGIDAAYSGIEMARTFENLKKPNSKIGFKK